MNTELRATSDRARSQSILILGIYLVLMIVAAIIFSLYVDKDSLQAVVRSSGALGIVAYFLIEVVYVTLTPLLNTVILVTSGYLFGGHGGFLMNFLATSVGLFVIVLLVKRYGRPLLHRLISPSFYRRFDDLVQKIGPITLLVVYVLPFTPDDELTYIAAAGGVGMKRFILPILIGTAAKSAYSYIGDTGMDGVGIAAYARVIALVVGLIVVGAQEYVFLRRRSIQQ